MKKAEHLFNKLAENITIRKRPVAGALGSAVGVGAGLYAGTVAGVVGGAKMTLKIKSPAVRAAGIVASSVGAGITGATIGGLVSGRLFGGKKVQVKTAKLLK